MKYNYLIKLRAGGILAFALILGLSALHLPAEKETVQTTEIPSGLTAGVAAAITTEDLSIDVTAGVSDALMDTANVAVAPIDTNVVGQGMDEENTETGEETQTAAKTVDGSKTEAEEKDTTVYGYSNLGIAVVEGNLNIREEATTDSKVVGKMTNHNACEILDKDGDWVKVKSGSVRGYVKTEYLVTGDQAKSIAEEEVITVATVNTTTLRVRESASTESSIVALVGEGEDLIVLKEKDGFYKVEVDDQKGWISGDYVDISKKLKTAASVTELKAGDHGVSDTRASLVSYALQFVGNRYVWGGTSLTNGIDCSGFTMQIYAHYGIGLPHHSGSQPGYGTRISASEARPGDLFFYGSGSHISHVAIYIGNGQIVHASSARTGIKISNAFYRTPICVVSYLN